MAENTHSQESNARGARIGRRLHQARWTLAAAILAIVVFATWPDAPWPVAVLAIAFVLAVAAFAPRRSIAERQLANVGHPHETPLDAVAAADIVAAVADPLIVFDAHGSAVQANRAATDAFGAIAPGVSLPLKFRAPEMQALIAAVLEHRVPPDMIDYAERVPVERVFRVAATPIGADTGLFALIFRDQSETRRIDRMRADFIANASHELRTPLASISGFIETLRGPAKSDPAAQEQFLSIMQSQSERMARLIDDLLSLSRLEMKPYLRPGRRLDVRSTVDSVIDTLAPLAAESGVAIERQLPSGPAELAGDNDELFQVFENLLENAIKYGQSGGRVIVSVSRGTGAGRSEIDIAFRDFGPGIAEEHIPRITERFYRVDVESSRARKGTGLGLAIVKHILTRHDGRLEIKSEAGKGAAFIVHLPAA